MRFGPRQYLAVACGLVAFLGFAAAGGPGDDVFVSAAPEPMLSQAELASFVISPAKPDVRRSSAKIGNPLLGIPATALGEELLHDVPPMPASTTVHIAPAALIAPPKIRTIWVEVTAYCSCKKCCGPYAKGITSSGKLITYNGGHFIAADLKILPYGTRVIVPGYNSNKPVEVIDRGGAIRGFHIDVFMPTHQQAVDWGKKRLQVVVME